MQIIVLFLAIAIIGIVTSRTMFKSDGIDTYVNIYVEGKVYKQVSAVKSQTIVIERNNMYNEIKVSPQSVMMYDSNCDNKNCIHQGEIIPDSMSMRIMDGWIVCLPNQVSIEVVRGEN